MDARLFRLAVLASAFSSLGATYSSPNFVVNAPTPELAREVAQKAESSRLQLAQEWLGHPLKNWFRPCQVTVQVGQVGAGGETKFTFAGGEVFGWNMRVQGTAERILDSVIPHEVSHTIFASHFRRPLPRWADEGAATLVEHESERRRQDMMLKQVFHTPQRIPLRQLLEMKEYPSDMQSVLTLYAEGYSLADYLVQQTGGKRRYLSFLQAGHEKGWQHAIRTHYGLPDISSLERNWSEWVIAGSPSLGLEEGQMIADASEPPTVPSRSAAVVRSQSPDSERSVPMTANASRRRDPLPRGEFLEAPAPRAVPKTKPVQDPALSGSEIAARRREGRERVIRQGWEVASAEAASPAPNGETSGEAKASGARQRFAMVKEQGRSITRSLEAADVDPFDDTRQVESARPNESPFETQE